MSIQDEIENLGRLTFMDVSDDSKLIPVGRVEVNESGHLEFRGSSEDSAQVFMKAVTSGLGEQNRAVELFYQEVELAVSRMLDMAWVGGLDE